MVLQHRDQDPVAAFQARSAEGIGDQIDCLGGIPGEDDAVGRGCAKERGDPYPGVFIGLGRRLAQGIDRAVDVRVAGLVELPHPV
jgi:hypothetical protein